MGWANSVPIFHNDITFILQPETPYNVLSFIDDVGTKGPKDWRIIDTPLLQCSAKLPNPRPPSAPTSGNSNTSSADPDGSLINSDAFSTAVDASPEFPWTPKAFPDAGTIHFPTDPIRMSPWPIPRSHPTTINSAQFHQAAAISSALWSHPVLGI
ncbi:hypothetical protein E4T56_gene594 [Termitomyces sp. T112]|nr:hypothetical protein E4T56_gene594 [Termitomyces sp. T112]